MKNAVIIHILDVLKNVKLNNEHTTITLKKGNLHTEYEFNFFELYGLYLELMAEGYELLEMKKDSITVKKIS